jgi:DNA mismatch repair ATPase MutS
MRQMGPLIRTAERLLRTTGAGRDESAEITEDIRRLRPLRRIAQWVSRDPLASGDFVAGAWEYLNLLFILDANALLLSARHLRRLCPVLGRVAAWVGDVDVALSIASLRAEPRSWSMPAWSQATRTRAEGMWHPLVGAPVANDVDLCSGAGIVITGANMSGKSTYLRTTGIAAVLARAFDTCPATSWEGRSFRVRSLIGRNDDLSLGKSYYQVEADGVVGLLDDAREELPTLFLLDELLRGTNTIERLAAGEAVLKELLSGHVTGSPHVVVVATHDGELVSMLDDLYLPFHFREMIGPGGLSFDYRRREGPASTRTAIALLESTGAPKEVVEAARARAEQLDEASSPGSCVGRRRPRLP